MMHHKDEQDSDSSWRHLDNERLEHGLLPLRIQDSQSQRTALVRVDPTSTVADLKMVVAQSFLMGSKNPYIRLIKAGHMLTPDDVSLTDCALTPNQVVHAVILKEPPPKCNNSTSDHEEDSEDGSSSLQGGDDDDDDDIGLQPRRRHLPLGFDRLRVTAGLRRTEIAAVRMYFGRYVDSQQFLDEPDLTRRRRLQEEAWMQAQGPHSEFRLNLHTTVAAASNPRASGGPGTDRDFLWGFLLGFFVGFVMLLWVVNPSVNHRQRWGICCGYSLYVMVNMMRAPEPVEYLDEYPSAFSD